MVETGLEKRLGRLEEVITGNGHQLSLEDKIVQRIEKLLNTMRDRIEQVARHGDNNMKEGHGNLLHLLEEETEAREQQHADNLKVSQNQQKDLDEIKAMVHQVVGMGKLLVWMGKIGGAVGGIVGIIWVVLQIKTAVGHH